MKNLIIGDGAMGTELRRRGVEVPSHVESIWSALALKEATSIVEEIHIDYIEAGSDYITTNNYAVTRPILSRDNLDNELESLTIKSIELAKSALSKTNSTKIKVLGALPPLETSYRADLILEEEELNKRLVASFRLLIEEVSTYKNINLSKSEFELGFTTLVSGLVSNSKKEIYDGNVAVTYMGKADFVGRLDGDVPLVVELKTGKERDEHKLEADLYAIGAKTILKEEKIIVLHIYLDTNSAKVVERVYETKDFAKLNEFFISKACLLYTSPSPRD